MARAPAFGAGYLGSSPSVATKPFHEILFPDHHYRSRHNDPMGFEPKNSHPVHHRNSYLSIMGAKVQVAELQAAIAIAELAEQNEYLSYRLRLHDAEVTKLSIELAFYKTDATKKKRRKS
jgi:hypothetical protein